MLVLNPHELRVVGALVEKQISTPDYYPLSLNALVNACNQKNHRDPVVMYGETEVRRAIESLRDKGLAFVFEGADARVPKFGHSFPTALGLDAPELAVMAVLILRGPQTPGELRSRTAHLHEFASLAEVDGALLRLGSRPEPLVKKLPRAPGTKEARYAQLLGGDVPVEDFAQETTPSPVSAPGAAEPDRIAKLESDVAVLQQEFREVKAQLAELKKQLE